MTAPGPDLAHPRYPRASGYPAQWVLDNQMGPNALWLLEALTEVLPIEADSRVLDLGCGRAMTSVFLAREFGAQVWAADLWIAPGDNERRIQEAGVGDRVTPISVEAHSLPFAAGFFDVIVSIDAYQYFGTADLYLGYLVDYLRPGGRIGAVMPAGLYEVGTEVPAHLEPHWDWEYCCFHSPEWWRDHWAKTGKVAVDHADVIEDGWADWHRFNELLIPGAEGWLKDDTAGTKRLLEADGGGFFGFTRVAATKV